MCIYEEEREIEKRDDLVVEDGGVLFNEARLVRVVLCVYLW